jgi:hypothetical protein
MEKIIGVLQRLLKNILNYNMDKSEKSYYAIIENKKRGKFYGTSPIQVAKKVASKKLKSGKEIEFYLDEAGGKKKRYGPYQATKDKKSGKVAVVKGKKVMKGGVLSDRFRNKLKETFINFNSEVQKKPEKFYSNKVETFQGDANYIPLDIRDDFTNNLKYSILYDTSDMKRSDIIYFCPFDKIYRFAIFTDDDGIIYIMIYENDDKIDIVNMTDFFLNPFYLYIFDFILNKRHLLTWFKEINQIDNLQGIRQESEKICNFLYDREDIPWNRQKAMIYVPDDSQPLIKKCVYSSNLTFGIFHERTSDLRNAITDIPIPTSFYQLFLIKQKQKSIFKLFSKSEFVIYIQLQLPNMAELEKKSITKPFFSFCIYTDPMDSNKLKIKYKKLFVDFSNKISTNFDELLNVCYILLTIPEEFGEFSNVRQIARDIIKKFNNNKLKRLPMLEMTNFKMSGK